MTATAKDPWSYPTKSMINTKNKLDKLTKTLKSEALQAGLDVAGIADPTPFTDLASAGLSIAKGDWIGAGLSLISAIPYFGDAVGKSAKMARTAKRIQSLKKKIGALTTRLEMLAKAEADKAAKKAAEFAKERAKQCKSGKCKGKPTRKSTMGATPSKTSKTGKAVIARMRKEHPEMFKKSGKNLEIRTEDGVWRKVYSPDIHMGHNMSAVEFQNKIGKYAGDNSPRTRAFMNDPNNYTLEYGPLNQSKGGGINPSTGKRYTYQPEVMDRY